MKATIEITNSNGKMIKKYKIEYNKPKELYNVLKENRKVWEDYYVKGITPTHNVSYSHTYKEEKNILNNFAKLRNKH